MTMAPQGDLARARSVFDDLKTLHEKLRAQMSGENATCFDELSMGMSEDWREAVCAGATIVRIGRAVFSDAFERGGLEASCEARSAPAYGSAGSIASIAAGSGAAAVETAVLRAGAFTRSQEIRRERNR